jgi:hypothetical protein
VTSFRHCLPLPGCLCCLLALCLVPVPRIAHTQLRESKHCIQLETNPLTLACTCHQQSKSLRILDAQRLSTTCALGTLPNASPARRYTYLITTIESVHSAGCGCSEKRLLLLVRMARATITDSDNLNAAALSSPCAFHSSVAMFSFTFTRLDAFPRKHTHIAAVVYVWLTGYVHCGSTMRSVPYATHTSSSLPYRRVWVALTMCSCQGATLGGVFFYTFQAACGQRFEISRERG